MKNKKMQGLRCLFSASMGLPLRAERMRWLSLKIVTFVTAFPSTVGAVHPHSSPSGEQTTRRKEREKNGKERARVAELQSSCALNKARLVGKYGLLWCWKPTHPHLSLFSSCLFLFMFLIRIVCVCHSLFHAGILAQRRSSLDERARTTFNQSWRAGGGGTKHGARMHLTLPSPSLVHSTYFSFCLTHTCAIWGAPAALTQLYLVCLCMFSHLRILVKILNYFEKERAVGGRGKGWKRERCRKGGKGKRGFL